METRSHTRTKSKTDFRYKPYYQKYNRRSSFTNSQFTIWKQRIDKYVYDIIGYHLDDLPDLQYRQWFDDGYLKPMQVAYIVLGEFYQVYNLNQLYFNN